MIEVRDSTAEDFLLMKTGSLKSTKMLELNKILSELDSDSKKTVEILVGEFVDRTIYYMLWMFENSERFTIAEKENLLKGDLVEQSDGISGELFGDDGWFSKYSKNLLETEKR